MKKVWQPTTLQPLVAHGQIVPFWKPPISHCLEPDGHGGVRTYGAQNPLLKVPILKGKIRKRWVVCKALLVDRFPFFIAFSNDLPFYEDHRLFDINMTPKAMFVGANWKGGPRRNSSGCLFWCKKYLIKLYYLWWPIAIVVIFYNIINFYFNY